MSKPSYSDSRKKLLLLSKLKLIKECKKCKVSNKGSKNEMVERILASKGIKKIPPKPKHEKSYKWKKAPIVYIAGQKKLKRLIAGYIREQNDAVLLFAFSIIHCFSSSILYNQWINISVSKKSHKHIGKKTEYKEAGKFPSSSRYYFNDNKCLNCFQLDCLKFHCGYNDKPSNSKKIITNTMYRRCTEYKCKLCGYYIAHIIKMKYLQYFHEETTGRGSYARTRSSTNYDYVQPWVNKDKKSKVGRTKCPDCKELMIYIDSSYYCSDGHRSTHSSNHKEDFCKNCEILRVQHSAQSC
eukprot:458047_1